MMSDKFYIKANHLTEHSVVVTSHNSYKLPTWDKNNPISLNIFEARNILETVRKTDKQYNLTGWTYEILPIKENK